MGYARAWLRIFGIAIALGWYLSGLVVRTWVFGQDRNRGLRYRRKYIRTSLAILGVDLVREGSQIDEPALYVSNHRSMLDPFINLLFIDAVIVSKAEVSRYPLVGFGAKLTGVIFVERDKGSSRAAAKEAIREALQNGLPVLIYPEGTTSNLETTREFKLGSFNVAAEEGKPVVPVMLEYRDPEHKWHEGALLPFFLKKFSAKEIEAATVIGSPMISSDAESLRLEAQEWVGRQLRMVQKQWNGKSA